jgi:hypothetical protein
VGNVVWVYPTSTVKDNAGNAINLAGSLTSTADIILVSVVTNYKLFGANIGGSAAFPFIKNRIQADSLDFNTGFAYTDMLVSAALGWTLKRADITAGYNLYIPTGRFSSGSSRGTTERREVPHRKGGTVYATPDAKTFQFMAEAVRNGKLVIPISRKLPLSKAAEAQAAAEQRGIGKALLVA